MSKTKLVKFNPNSTAMAAMGFSKVEKERVIVEDAGVPRIFNYSSAGKKGGLGDEILASIPNVEEGSPILSIGGDFIELNLKKARYIVLPNFLRQFWANRDYGKKLLNASNEKQKYGAGKKDGQTTGYLENFLTLMIIVGAVDRNGTKLMPVPTVSTLDKSRCPFLIGARKALTQVSSKEWAANATENAKLVAAGVPESLRVAHRIKVKLDTASHGLKYAKWTADSQTCSEELVAEIQEAMGDESWQERFQEAQDMYASISESIDDVIA